MDRFARLKHDVDRHYGLFTSLLDDLEKKATESGDRTMLSVLAKKEIEILHSLNAIRESSSEILPVVKTELKKRTSRLENKIEELKKAKDTLVSDNYLLEHKKNELALLANSLEDAYDEISRQNNALVLQQEKISEQAESLNKVHTELLAKNEALEIQKEALLDQSDYLHEANESISRMHQEVELQKNEIMQKNAELHSLNIEKNNLIGIVAHDLKSPLNQIRGLLGLMKKTEGGLNEEASSYVDMMENVAGRLSEMITKILDTEAIESKKMNLKPEPVFPGEILSKVIERYKFNAVQKDITLHERYDTNRRVEIDRDYAEQVFENLLTNALKFSPRDKNIFITLCEKGNELVCGIRDEGPGLSEDDKKKLFTKYQKLSARPTGNETSTGLGLSIVKKYTEAMNGRIWCESTKGHGAGFYVAFPLIKEKIPA